jgi:hypothetical protein
VQSFSCVPVIFEGRELQTAIDSGPCHSFIDSRVFTTLQLPLEAWQDGQVCSVTGDLLDVTGSVSIPIKLGSSNFTWKFGVVTNFVTSILAGRDFLLHFGISADYRKNGVVLNDSFIPFTSYVSKTPSVSIASGVPPSATAETCYLHVLDDLIPSRHVYYITAKVCGPVADCPYIFEPIFPFAKHDCLAVPRVYFDTLRGRATVRVPIIHLTSDNIIFPASFSED